MLVVWRFLLRRRLGLIVLAICGLETLISCSGSAKPIPGSMAAIDAARKTAEREQEARWKSEWEAERVREQARAAIAEAQAAERSSRLAREVAARAEEDARQRIAASQEARQHAEAELAAAREHAQKVAGDRQALLEAQAARRAAEAQAEQASRNILASEEARKRAEADAAAIREQSRRIKEDSESPLRKMEAERQQAEARDEQTLRKLSESEEARKVAETELARVREQARKANEDREAAERQSQAARAESGAVSHEADTKTPEAESSTAPAAANPTLAKNLPSGLFASGPGASSPPPTERQQPDTPPAAARSSGGAAVHKIGPSDLLAIEAPHVEEISGETRVAANGRLELPLVGAVVAAGRSEQELAAELERRLATYVRAPSVTVRIANQASRPVVIDGEVKSPGTYPVPEDGQPMLQVISAAGGITGGTRHARIEHTRAAAPSEPGVLAADAPAENDARSSFDVDVTKLDSSALATTGVLPGDSISVRPVWVVTVEGWVTHPSTYTFLDQPTLTSALAAAGGTLFPSRRDGIKIVRSEQLRGGADDVARLPTKDEEIRDGEIIRVPSWGVLVVPWAMTRIFTWPFY